MVLGLLAALGAAVVFGASAVLQAVAVRRAGLLSPWMAVVTLGYLVGWGMHLYAIAQLPLYLAQMAVGGSLAVTALVASRVVHEPLERRHWAAVVGMAIGFALLIGAAGPVGRDDQHRELSTVLYVAFALLACGGWIAWRAGGARSGVALALLAGLSYSGTPVATRALLHPGPDLHTLVHGLPIALFGVLGFVLQSLALERVTVTAATAPMVLLETFVPAVLGVVLFGDQVHHRLGALALLGFLVATAGALVLSGAEARLDHLEHVPEEPIDALGHAHG